MAGQHSKRNRRSHNAKARRRGVVGLGSGAGAMLAFGMGPLAAAPPANADGLDVILEPIINSLSSVDPTLGADLTGWIAGLDSALAATSGADPATSTASLDMVGAPYDALKQACYGAQRERLLLVQYETLTTDPAKTLHAIYSFLGEPSFEHDFDHVDYDVTEFDERAATPGLHTVRGTVKAEPRPTLLPPDLFNRFVNDAFGAIRTRFPKG